MVGCWIVQWEESDGGAFIFTSTEKLMEYIDRFPAFKILYGGDPWVDSVIAIIDTSNCLEATAYQVKEEDVDPKFDEDGYIHLA